MAAISVALAKQFKELQDNLQQHYEAQGKLGVQKTENELVLEELKNAEAGAVIYKAVGPALIKQEQSVCVDNVEKRLEYINGERARIEKIINEVQSKLQALAKDIESQRNAGLLTTSAG